MGLGLGSRSHGALRPHDVDLARGEQARRAEVEVVLDTVLPEDGVAGVLAAVDTRHDLDLGVAGDGVDGLALALVPEVGAWFGVRVGVRVRVRARARVGLGLAPCEPLLGTGARGRRRARGGR